MPLLLERNPKPATAPRVSSEPEALLTVREVADILHVPASWIYDHTRPGCLSPIPHVKLGKYLRFSPADVSAFLDSLRTLGRKRH